jgi:hypothetical protein
MEIGTGIEIEAIFDQALCRKHCPKGMSLETAGHRTISLGRSSDPNRHPHASMRRQLERDLFPATRFNSEMNSGQPWRAMQFRPPSIAQPLIAEPLQKMKKGLVEQKLIAQNRDVS